MMLCDMAKNIDKRIEDSDIDQKTIGVNLARIRKEKGFTQAELAAHLDTIPTVISDYEHGRLRLHGKVIVNLAEFLGVSTDELLGVRQEKAVAAAPSRKISRRMQKIEQLPEQQQRALIQTIDAFLRAEGI